MRRIVWFTQEMGTCYQEISVLGKAKKPEEFPKIQRIKQDDLQIYVCVFPQYYKKRKSRIGTHKNSPYVGGEFTWPCPASRYISSSFGNRLHPTLKVWKFHTGVDIGCAAGKDIVAAASGRVIMSQWYGGYGNCVMIDHGGGIVTLYGHASKLLVSTGATVKRGQTIALVGSTGRSTGPHLHFEVRKDGEYIDPMSYF